MDTNEKHLDDEILIPVEISEDGKETVIRNLFWYKHLIDYNNPEEDLVFNLIFARDRGDTSFYKFSDIFTDEEILKMASSSSVENWMPLHQEWLKTEAAEILEKNI
jgi:hypothetical protein